MNDARPLPAKAAPAKEDKKMERTTNGLRAVLFDELEALRNGKSTPHRAVAVAQLAAQIVRSARLDIEFQQHVKHTLGDNAPVQLPTLTLAA